jgi:hypothetical protein
MPIPARDEPWLPQRCAAAAQVGADPRQKQRIMDAFAASLRITPYD